MSEESKYNLKLAIAIPLSILFSIVIILLIVPTAVTAWVIERVDKK